MEPLFFILALFSEIVGTVVGFGSSTILLPLSLFFFDFGTSLVLVALFHVFGNLGRVGFFKEGLDKNILLTFGLSSVFLTLLGASLVPVVPQSLLKGILGVFLVLYCLITFWKENFRVRITPENSILGGGLSGFLAGLIGTGGALRGAFLMGFGLSKESYIATSAAIALATDITRLPVYLSQGLLGDKHFLSLPILFGVAVLGSFIGRVAVKRIPLKLFKKLVLMAILLLGTKLIYDWLKISSGFIQ